MPTAAHVQLQMSHHSFDGSEDHFAGIQHHPLLDPKKYGDAAFQVNCYVDLVVCSTRLQHIET